MATPIGNLGDITLRALETLRAVDVIAAEDTRHTRKLLSHYDIHKPLTSYHSHNAAQRGPELLGRLLQGQDVALVTDAGTPAISDPGALLVAEALELDLEVTILPGPTALVAALVVSGLSTHPFVFLGFPPPRGKERRNFFESAAAFRMTRILYESPQRTRRTLEDIFQFWGDLRIAVAREMTKIHEEVFRGRVSAALEHFSEGVRGELVLVVEGAGPASGIDAEGENWKEELGTLMAASGLSVKEASDDIAGRFGLSRRVVYQEALRIKGSSSP
ncbi:16S rRNA (cytidine(1402)-2'-O)-methyltransferase [Desulforhabdus sp. TSK]|uniref:16S rRNA (cytidine(1402)-2'-O)-methyltransferase n=1 Tax=Desulforhabdus sp. TSK TaxID=2925014 RepID=UPI001FC815E1|nr:16S rRNA (cytidine(1402)-2'-O)-methyltransferase [Desulforhabdus sp. TSK]